MDAWLNNSANDIDNPHGTLIVQRKYTNSTKEVK